MTGPTRRSLLAGMGAFAIAPAVAAGGEGRSGPDRQTSTTSQRPTPEPNLPISFAAFPQAPRAGERIEFFVASSAVEVDVVDVQWDFDGDGKKDGSGLRVGHIFPEPGRYPVTMRARTADGRTKTVTREIVVGPAVSTTSPATSDTTQQSTWTTGGRADTTGVSIPGFGILTALVGLGSLALAGLRQDD